MKLLKQGDRVVVVGTGVIGAGWVARLLLNGFDVVACDSNPRREVVMRSLKRAEEAYSQLYEFALPKQGSLQFENRFDSALQGAALVIEAVPEELALKQSVYQQVEDYVSDEAVVLSSTSGLLPSELQKNMKHPERFLVAHPFNPVYLLPLVELVCGSQTDSSIVERVKAFLLTLGMQPLVLEKEIEAFVADRLLEAVWRESLWLIKDGIATTEQVDDAIRYGFGLRWAQMGLFETYRIAGGEAGMKHFLHQFGPYLKAPWTRLSDVPELDEALIDTLVRQSDAQSGSHSIAELETLRDHNLVTLLLGLKRNRWGAGRTLAEHEAQWMQKDFFQTPVPAPLHTFTSVVPPEYADYNGHMNEAYYLHFFSLSTTYFMHYVGCNQAYIDAGNSFFTLETHICHLQECDIGSRIQVKTQLLGYEGKKVFLFKQMFDPDGQLLATAEQFLLHMDMNQRRSCEPLLVIAQRLKAIWDTHRHLPIAPQVGRKVGAKPA